MSDVWERRYSLCRKFASFYNSEFRLDIVHNAWLRYYEATGEDLFLIELKNENSYLYTIVKRAFLYWSYLERKSDKYIYSGTDSLTSKFNDPEDQLIGKDLYELFYKKLHADTEPNENKHYRNDQGRQLPLEVFRLKVAGYSQKDIADQLSVSKQLVNQYNKKIEKMSQVQWNNPFKTSQTKIKNKLTEVAWSKRKDHDEYEKEDWNEWFELYTHKDTKDGILVKLDNPTNSEFYVKRLVDSEK